MTDGDQISPDSLPVEVSGTATIFSPSAGEEADLSELLDRFEWRILNLYYEKYGNIRDAALHLKMAPTTFLRHKTNLGKKYGCLPKGEETFLAD